MDRKNFIKTCGLACAGAVGMTTLLQGCSSTKILSGKVIADDLVVPISDFETKNGNNTYFKTTCCNIPFVCIGLMKKSTPLCGCNAHTREQSYRYLATGCNALHTAANLIAGAAYKMARRIKN